ncbi:hypothetical protein AB0M58_13380 [Streptomyces bobili]|uniref:hypothetical protein n=1 Tax=Streptomyces bobili TaxID=67280 RepID=UPI00344A421B
MLDTVPPHRLMPFTDSAVRWHLPDDESSHPDAVDVTCQVLAANVTAAWATVKEQAAARRRSDPAMNRLVLNLHLEGLDAHADGCTLALYVSSPAIHDMLHARTGARFTEALSAEARLSLKVADCDSRLRWTRSIRCQWVEPKLAPIEPDWAAITARQEAIIDGRIVEADRQAASNRLLLALERRAGIRYTGAQWGQHPEGMFTLRCEPKAARRLLELGIPAMPQLAENGPTVAFTLTDQECHDFTQTVIAAAGEPR